MGAEEFESAGSAAEGAQHLREHELLLRVRSFRQHLLSFAKSCILLLPSTILNHNSNVLLIPLTRGQVRTMTCNISESVTVTA